MDEEQLEGVKKLKKKGHLGEWENDCQGVLRVYIFSFTRYSQIILLSNCTSVYTIAAVDGCF